MAATVKKSDAQSTTYTMRPSEVTNAILGMRKTGRAVFMWGPPGISKSAVSQQVATMLGIAFIDVRLSQMDPTDLRGIPFPTDDGGVQGVEWSAPLVLPRDLDIQSVREIEAIETIIRFHNPKGVNRIHYCTKPTFEAFSLTDGLTAEVISVKGDRAVVVLRDENGKPAKGKVAWTATGKVDAILGLEEFNSAPPSVQAAAYQLILDKRLGAYEVPDGVYMLAMGNRDNDRGVTFKMPTPIMNRFVHIEMKPHFDDWQTWALNERIHWQVVGFLTAFQDLMFRFNPGTAARGFETPRSWHFVSDILRENEDTLPEPILRGLIIGCVGEASGHQFMEFRKVAQDLPLAGDILSGKLKRLPGQIANSLAFALTTTMCYQLKEKADEIQKPFGGAAATPIQKKEMRKTDAYDAWTKEADNFLGFIQRNFPSEVAILGGKASLSTYELPFDAQRMEYFTAFAERYKAFIL